VCGDVWRANAVVVGVKEDEKLRDAEAGVGVAIEEDQAVAVRGVVR